MKFSQSWRPLALMLILASSLIACRTVKLSNSDKIPDDPEILEVVDVFSQPVVEDLPPYRESAHRKWDLLHTRLDLSFDWAEQAVKGKATLSLKPVFYTQSQLELDARGFAFHSIRLKGDNTANILPYNYDSTKVTISLPRSFKREDTIHLEIRYTAYPASLDSLGLEEGAGQGLYFIDHDGKDPNKPQQIWTQGETQANSCWFPTIDRPIERCTQEMHITVQDRFKTLSNGVLVSSNANPDGTRTDHWEMRQTHSPYLFMVAVGEFAVVKDEWRGKEVSYYLEPEYEPYARLIFGKTPGMMEFFSKKLGVDFPWDKYAQVVVREFVSGAMENTTATIHMDALQHDDRSHLDNSYEGYVSHELVHQWFGNLVTCESWANLALNEGFATYGEFLWMEYDHGPDEAARHFITDRKNYLGESNYVKHPLIHFRYEDREDMFDNHSYAKGGQIVHMLRNLLGDEAFFASLKKYLSENAYSPVESHELRMAFEETVGQDLNWFFNQWFFAEGHPVLEVNHLEEAGLYQIEVKQTQDGEAPRIFRFPLRIGVREAGTYSEYFFWMNSRDTTFSIPVTGSPEFVAFNADGVLLSEVSEKNKSLSQWAAQIKHGNNYYQKYIALDALEEFEDSPELWAAYTTAIKDPFWGVSAPAMGNCPRTNPQELGKIARDIIPLIQSEHVEQRNAALRFFLRFDEKDREEWNWTPKDLDELKRVVGIASDDRSYQAQRNAVWLLYRLSPNDGVRRARELLPNAPNEQKSTFIRILAEENDPSVKEFCNELMVLDSWSARMGAFEALSTLASKHGSEEAVEMLKREAVEQEPWWMRMMVARSMKKIPATDELRAFYKQRSEIEEEAQLKRVWEQISKE